MYTLARRCVSRNAFRCKPIKIKPISLPATQVFRKTYVSYTYVEEENVGTGPKQKTTTGIPGVPVVPRAREILTRLYERYLEDIKILPEDCPYRVYMTRFIQHRLDICRTTEDIFEIEDKIGCGQIEELIQWQEDEHKMIAFMDEYKPWMKGEDKWDTRFYLYSPVR